jgi:hypothetical protein
MSSRAEKLAQELMVFVSDLRTFLEKCSEADWNRRLEWEGWSVGVTARHIAAGHLPAIALAKMIVNSAELPELTSEQVTAMANDHARKHAACTRDEVLGILKENGAAMAAYVAGLSDADLDRTGQLALVGGVISAENLIKAVILKSGGEHLAHMKAASAR